MNPRTRWTLLGLLAGAAVTATVFLAARRGDTPIGSLLRDSDDDERLERLDARLRSIEAAMRARSAAPRAAPPAGPVSPSAPRPDSDPAAERAATVAEVEEFLRQHMN